MALFDGRIVNPLDGVTGRLDNTEAEALDINHLEEDGGVAIIERDEVTLGIWIRHSVTPF